MMMNLLRKLAWYALLACVMLGSMLAVTSAHEHPFLVDQVLGGQPAPRYLSESERVPPASVGFGEVLAGQGYRGLVDQVATVEEFFVCTGPSSWHLDEQGGRYPSMMMVYPVHPARGFVMASDLKVRPWSFDGLKGKFNVALLCA